MKVEIEKEHEWLEQLAGEWTYETECSMGPDQPPMKSTGTERVRSLGGLWVVCEGQNEMPECGVATTVMTLGYDPRKKCYRGTFVASMMSHLWIYEGGLDAIGRALTLDTEGPNCLAEGKMAKYQDIIEIKNTNHRTLRSRVLGDDGTWNAFMTANYRRTA